LLFMSMEDHRSVTVADSKWKRDIMLLMDMLFSCLIREGVWEEESSS